VAAVHELAATDVISYTNINMATATLHENLAEPFDAGYFMGVVDSMVAHDLRKDSTWQSVATYKDSVPWLLNGELGEAYGVRWARTTQSWRHAIDSYTYSATGAVHVVPIFGADALAMYTLEGEGNHIIVVSGPDKSDPLDQFDDIGWKVINAVKTQNALSSVLLLCGASAMA
jgi:N4-gp56 family major capsid protein